MFNPAPGDVTSQNLASARPAKRRKIAKSAVSQPQHDSAADGPPFPSLFSGAESPDAARLRKELFDAAWPVLEGRIQVG